MPSPFHNIDLASRALRAFQYAISTTGNNIANVNTRGYSRQAVDIVATDPVNFWSNGMRSLGTGVNVSSINRIRDMFLDGRMQQASSELASHSEKAQSLESVLAVMNEPGADGIQSALSKFFDSWSGLASNPAEAANRMAVQTSGRNLTSKIRTAYQQMSGEVANINAQITTTIDQINQLGLQIGKLNEEIRAQTAAGGTPNSLFDARDLALKDLSSLVNVSTTMNLDNTVNVFVSEYTLVDAAGNRPMPTTFDATAQTVTGWLVPVNIRGGKLAGLMQSAQTFDAQMANLDSLANTLKASVNAIHTVGITKTAATNVLFFNDANPQTGAIDFDLSSAVSSDFNNIATGSTSAQADVILAQQIRDLRQTPQAGLGNRSVFDFHRENVAQIGSQKSYFSSQASTQSAIIEQTDQQQQAVSGVNLDDEMANLLRYQRSYQAAAKALTIFDQVTEDLIGMLRR